MSFKILFLLAIAAASQDIDIATHTHGPDDATRIFHSGGLDKCGGHNCSEKSKQKGLCTGYHYHQPKKC